MDKEESSGISTFLFAITLGIIPGYAQSFETASRQNLCTAIDPVLNQSYRDACSALL